MLRNPDITDRCSKPELFDRYGRVKNEPLEMLGHFYD
jgi:hypothetical protein